MYVTGSCLQKNTSANMSHNSYIQGLIENGCKVDVIMAKDSFGSYDKLIPKYKEVTYYEYNSIPIINYVRDFVKRILGRSVDNYRVANETNSIDRQSCEKKINLKNIIFNSLKLLYNKLIIGETLYPLDRKWLKTASHFKSNSHYDLIISNSSPSASHALVDKIKGKLSYDKWIQIWEDPWYFDIYGQKDKKIYEEEKRLISTADNIFYVSPLTLMYQKKYFCEYSSKMDVIPLPFFKVQKETTPETLAYGYFGDYYSKTRNLEPFYQAMINTNSKGYIYGDSDKQFNSTNNITVNGRVTLDELINVQNKTLVYVSLCNLNGGQIPGKIYHYSATNKPIIFILDGTDDEIEIIYKYFKQFDRYYFCKNTVENISQLLNRLNNNELSLKKMPIEQFSPQNTVNLLLKKVGINL